MWEGAKATEGSGGSQRQNGTVQCSYGSDTEESDLGLLLCKVVFGKNQA